MSQHHYIPKFYLRGFTDPNCPTGYEPYVWVYERGETTPKKKAPKNVAASLHYYSVRTDKGFDPTPEGVIAQVESIAAPLLKKFSEGQRELTEEERQEFAAFAALMYLRVPGIRNNIEDFAARVAQKVLLTMAMNEETLEQVVTQYEEESGDRIDVPTKSLFEYIRDKSRYKITASPNVSLQALLEQISTLAPIIVDMKWLVLMIPDGGHFITSDGPVVLVDPTDSSSFYGPGFIMQDVEVTFPLTRSACLLATWEGSEGYEDATVSRVEEMNRRTMNYARQYVFSSRELI